MYCTMCMPNALGGQKKASDPLEVEYHAAVSHHVNSENQTQVLNGVLKR